MGGTLLLATFNRKGLQRAALSAMNNTGLVGASSSAAAANTQTSTALETKLNNLNLGSSFAVGGNDTSNISSSIPEERMSNRLKETLRNDPGLNCLKEQLSRVNDQIQMHEEWKLRVAKAEEESKRDMEAKSQHAVEISSLQTTSTANPWVKY